MTHEEAEQKAQEAYEMDLIKHDEIEAYAQHLFEQSRISEKDK